jgi:hypothetical protein
MGFSLRICLRKRVTSKPDLTEFAIVTGLLPGCEQILTYLLFITQHAIPSRKTVRLRDPLFLFATPLGGSGSR